MPPGKPVRNFEDSIDETLALVYDKPLDYVMWAFPWNFDPSIQRVRLPPEYKARFPECEFGPDRWACQYLDRLGEEIRKRAFDGEHAVMPIQMAAVSGHGIGKSVMCAWLVKFISDTRPFSRGTVTANTAGQLSTKTWAEVAKWHRMSLTSHRFECKTGRGSMILQHREVPDRWYCKAETCREENSEAFAGQHASDSTSYYIFDEASAIPAKIFEVRGGGLTDGEPMTFDFGNGTRNSGEFYDEMERDDANRFIKFRIDSRTASLTNKLYIQRMIDDYGLDSDYVKVRVLGQFPAKGDMQFISTESVNVAQQRDVNPNNAMYQLVLGVDPARGGTDESVIKPRIGDDARTWPARRFKGLDTVQLTGQVIRCVHEFSALGMRVAAIFVDANGLGAGVFDQLNHLGYPVVEVQASGSAMDKKVYRRLSDELWGSLADHIRRRLTLPLLGTEEGNDLNSQLTSREYDFTPNGQIQLESKKEMKSRLGDDASPNVADALALTYAQELAPVLGNELQQARTPTFTIHEYDPMAWIGQEMTR